MSATALWLAVGFGGQALFSLRFIAQWLSSEKAGRSVIPPVFWWLSLSGGLTLFAYALYRHDPVFALGQGAGVLVYLRNLYWLLRDRNAATA
ncbi:MAG: lipid-A-disaccharide synthase N-terminal domain-containing protein [Pseudomonadota bacterium]